MHPLAAVLCCLSFCPIHPSADAGRDARMAVVPLPDASGEIGEEPPAVVLLSPADGDTVGPAEYVPPGDPKAEPAFGIVVSASVSRPDGSPAGIRRATLLVNGQPRSILASPPDTFAFVWNPGDGLPSGPVTLQVKVEDAAGRTALSGQIVVRMESGSFLCPPGSRAFWCSLPPGGLIPFLAATAVLIALGFVLLARRDSADAEGFAGEGEEAGKTVRLTEGLPSVKATLTDLDGNAGFGVETRELFGTTPIGRSRRSAGLVLQTGEPQSPVSRLHCTILEEDGAFFLRDEQSANGTFLNGARLAPTVRTPLKDEDEIRLARTERGGVRLLFRVRTPDGSGKGGAAG
jgi:hypothetical protein